MRDSVLTLFKQKSDSKRKQTKNDNTERNQQRSEHETIEDEEVESHEEFHGLEPIGAGLLPIRI